MGERAEKYLFIFNGEGSARLDKFLSEQAGLGLSRMKIQSLIEEGLVSVNGLPVSKASYALKGGDEASLVVMKEVKDEMRGVDLPLDVIYEDANVIVINKPAGMVVHPGAGNPDGTLVNAALHRWPELATVGEPGRPGVVHRLDKDTSGIIMLAHNPTAYIWLVKQFKSRKTEKTYLALVDGCPPSPVGRIETSIARDEKHRQKMAVAYEGKGRSAVTEYRTLAEYNEHTLLEVMPLTGRTHQIRVHLAFIGVPVAGDRVYGRKRTSLEIPRFFLHAQKLRLALPGQTLPSEFCAPLPKDLELALSNLEVKRNENA